MTEFVACIERGEGFNSYSHRISAPTLPELLTRLKDYAEEASEHDYLCILESTQDYHVWEAIEDCWETYVVPAIEKRDLVKAIKLVEDNIVNLEFWFADLEATKYHKLKSLEMQRAHLKTLKEQL